MKSKSEVYARLASFKESSVQQDGFNWTEYMGLVDDAMSLLEPPGQALDRLRRAIDELPKDARSSITLTVCSLRSLIDDPIVGDAWRTGIELIQAEMMAALAPAAPTESVVLGFSQQLAQEMSEGTAVFVSPSVESDRGSEG